MDFISPTDGKMDIEKVYSTMIDFMDQVPENPYKLIVGTDSHPRMEDVVFVTAIVIYRVGRGGRFFYHKEKDDLEMGMKQRIFYEVSRSLEVASKLTGVLAQDSEHIETLDIEIHVDVGNKGPSSEIIKEVVGMVVGNGYEAMIKPESYAASSVADRYTK